MFCPPDLAARLDRAEASLCANMARIIGARKPEFSAFVAPIGGGSAIYAGPGSPMNKLIGAAFGSVPAAGDIDRVEAQYAQRGSGFQAEVSTLAEPDFFRLLVGRGYRLQGYENLLGRRLGEIDATHAHVTVEPCRDDESQRLWIELLADAFTAADVGGVGGDVTPPRDVIVEWGGLSAATPGLTCYLARFDGEPAGGAALYLHDGVAILGGAGTHPAFRRRGVQTTLLRARLAHAATTGAEFAMVTTQPGSKSQQNVQREGFSLLYSRALLVKSPDGA
jgi:GNAT superfamily N-acetyltransferase